MRSLNSTSSLFSSMFFFLSFLICVISLFAFNSPLINAQVSGGLCVWNGYNFTSLENFGDLYSWENSGTYFSFRPCNSLQLEKVCAVGTQVCQHTQAAAGASCPGINVVTTAAPAANYTWAYVNGQNNTAGISVTIQNGATGSGCTVVNGSQQRISKVTFLCNATANVPIVGAATESPPCQYNIPVQTSLACSTNPSPVTYTPLAGTAASSCSFGGINFGAAFGGADIRGVGTSSGWMYTLRLCGNVAESGCTSPNALPSGSLSTSSCQHPSICAAFISYNLGSYTNSGWSYINGANSNGGVQLTMSNGGTSYVYAAAGGASNIVCSSTSTIVQFFCGTSQASGDVIEGTNCVFTWVIFTPIVCSNGNGPTTGSCIAGSTGYDLTGFSTFDIIAPDTGSSQWYLTRLCGVMSDAVCSSNTEAQENMMCQRTSCTGSAGVATYDPSYMNWNSVTINGLSGISVNITNGAGTTGCSSTNNPFQERRMILNILCSLTAPTYPQYGSVVESPACAYTLTIYSNLVCYPPGSSSVSLTVPPFVNTTQPSCVYAGVDWGKTFGASEISGLGSSSGWLYKLRVCGAVSEVGCGYAHNPASLQSLAQFQGSGPMSCQLYGITATTVLSTICYPFHNYYFLGTYYGGVANSQWSLLTQGASQIGVQLSIPNGGPAYQYAAGTSAYCSSSNTTVNFLCSTTTTTTSYTVAEAPGCIFEWSIYTPLACAGGQAPSTDCISGSIGYNMSGFSQIDMLAHDSSGNQWYVTRLCGVMTNPLCLSLPGTANSMTCQVQSATAATNVAVYYPGAITWTSVSGGIQAFIGNGAGTTGCSSTNDPDQVRQLYINFLCSTTAPTYPTYGSVSETPACTYSMTVYTNLVCFSPGAVVPYIASSPVSSSCGAFGYNLASISGADLIDSSNVFHLHVCGAVTDASCLVQYPNSMICSRPSTTSAYPWSTATNIATYNPSLSQGGLTWTYTNGIDYTQGITATSAASGSACAAGGSNNGVINFVCLSSANPPLLTVQTAINNGCTYVLTIQTSILCSAPTSPSSSAAAQVSPSSSAATQGPASTAASHAPTTATSTPNTPYTPSSAASQPTGSTTGPGVPTSSSSSSSLSTGAIVGIVIGGCIGLCLILACIVFFCCGVFAGSGRKKDAPTASTADLGTTPHVRQTDVELSQVTHEQPSEVDGEADTVEMA